MSVETRLAFCRLVSRLHLCATSRSEFDIRASLGPFALRSVSLHESGQKNDIVDHVHYASETMMKSRREQVKKMVVGSLSEKADGMFRSVFYPARNTTTLSSVMYQAFSE